MATKKTVKSASKPRASAKKAAVSPQSAQGMRLTAFAAVFATLCIIYAVIVYMQYGR